MTPVMYTAIVLLYGDGLSATILCLYSLPHAILEREKPGLKYRVEKAENEANVVPDGQEPY
jgi:hypothetical protein